jgi:hypothetical protein
LEKLLDGLSVAKLFQVPAEIKNCFQLTDGIKSVLGDAAIHLKGSSRRIFMAKTVLALVSHFEFGRIHGFSRLFNKIKLL